MRIAKAFDERSQGLTLPKLPMMLVHPLSRPRRQPVVQPRQQPLPTYRPGCQARAPAAGGIPAGAGLHCQGPSVSWMAVSYFAQQREKPEGQVKFTEIKAQSPVVIKVDRLEDSLLP